MVNNQRPQRIVNHLRFKHSVRLPGAVAAKGINMVIAKRSYLHLDDVYVPLGMDDYLCKPDHLDITTAAAPAPTAAPTATRTVYLTPGACAFPSTVNNPLFAFQALTAGAKEERIAVNSFTRGQLNDTDVDVFKHIRPEASSQSGPARYVAISSTMREISLRITSGIWPQNR